MEFKPHSIQTKRNVQMMHSVRTITVFLVCQAVLVVTFNYFLPCLALGDDVDPNKADFGSDYYNFDHLSQKWKISSPTATIERETNTIRVNYGATNTISVGNSRNEIYDGFESTVTLWSEECQSGGGIQLMVGKNEEDASSGFANISIEAGVVDIALDPGFWIESHTHNESIHFCIRYALGTKIASSGEDTYIEMNFIESVVVAKAAIRRSSTSPPPHRLRDLQEVSDFEMTDVSISTKTTSSYQRKYNVEAFMCRGGGDNSRILQSISQGSIVTLCVQPDAAAKKDNVMIKSIEEFTFAYIVHSKRKLEDRQDNQPFRTSIGDRKNRSRWETLDQRGSGLEDPSSTPSQTSIPVIKALRTVISNGAPTDPLTIYEGCFGEDDPGSNHCSFGSILTADFFKVAGKVSGVGEVTLGFLTDVE